MSFTWPFLFDPVFFLDRHPCTRGCHPARGGMLLHDAVAINCKKGATTEHQAPDAKYMGYGVYVDDYVCVI